MDYIVYPINRGAYHWVLLRKHNKNNELYNYIMCLFTDCDINTAVDGNPLQINAYRYQTDSQLC